VVVIGRCLRVPKAKLEDKLRCEAMAGDAAVPAAPLHLAP
jgi:hypothetical protein